MTKLFPLFVSPVLVTRLADVDPLNEALSDRFRSESQTARGRSASNAGGWHSEPDLATRPEPAIQQLMSRFTDAATSYLRSVAGQQRVLLPEGFGYAVEAWAMVVRRGDHMTLHDHAEAQLSSVYYADAGDGEAMLSLVDPRRGNLRFPGLALDPTQFNLRPETGMIVVFPGWMQHFVHPYTGSRPRVSIAANLRVVRPPNSNSVDA